MAQLTKLRRKNDPILDTDIKTTIMSAIDNTKNGFPKINDLNSDFGLIINILSSLTPKIDQKTVKSVEKLRFFDLKTLKRAAISVFIDFGPKNGTKNKSKIEDENVFFKGVFVSKADFMFWLYKKVLRQKNLSLKFPEKNF